MRTFIFVAVLAITMMMATFAAADGDQWMDFQYHVAEHSSGSGGSPPVYTMFNSVFDYGDSGDDDHSGSYTVYLDEDFPRTNIDAVKTMVRTYTSSC